MKSRTSVCRLVRAMVPLWAKKRGTSSGGVSRNAPQLDFMSAGSKPVKTRVSLFVTCIVDQVFPQVGIAMAEVLERLGYPLDFPEGQTCCGQPAFNSGFVEEARIVERHFKEAFRGAEYIVVPSGSCATMISHHFEHPQR